MSLYENIHAKRKRIKGQKADKKAGKKVKVERMRKVGSKGAPTAKQFAEAAKTRTKVIG
jgi:hypothetical protein